ncbi:MAG: hypothetical protein IT366_05635 [Candidatus Hydrogenedentes bacterium]|nr:hypothetical protein [Candidatus Hydrogenedentota bacterium]
MSNMYPNACETAYQIFTFRTKKKTVRFLVSSSVMRQIPSLEEILMRACANDTVTWPQSIVITAVGENRWVPGDSLHMVFPEWLFNKVSEEQAKQRRWWKRLIVGRRIDWPSWDIAWTLAYYLQPIQPDDWPPTYDAVFLRHAIDMPFAYRPIGTTFRALLLLPLLILLLIAGLLGPFVYSRNPKLLYLRAHFQIAFGRAQGLSRTRQRLRELGEPEEKLKELAIRPCLNVVKSERPD